MPKLRTSLRYIVLKHNNEYSKARFKMKVAATELKVPTRDVRLLSK